VESHAGHGSTTITTNSVTTDERSTSGATIFVVASTTNEGFTSIASFQNGVTARIAQPVLTSRTLRSARSVPLTVDATDAYEILTPSTEYPFLGTRFTRCGLALVAYARQKREGERSSASGTLSRKERFKIKHPLLSLQPHRLKRLGPPWSTHTLRNGLFATRRLDHVVQYHRTCKVRGAFQPTDG
jgi:hypothetical protein